MDRAHDSVDSDGFVVAVEEADIGTAFIAVIDDVVAAVTEALPESLHSLYLYGSVPRDTAVIGISDLDVLVCLYDPPTPSALATVNRIAEELSKRYAGVVREVGIGVTHVADIHADPNGLGFFLKILCICIHGEDLRCRLPRYRPTSEVALALNGDVGELLGWYEQRIGDATTAEDYRRVVGAACRKLIRSAFGMVMVRSQSWTPDRDVAAATFLQYFPEWSEEMHQALRWAKGEPASRDDALALLRGFGAWMCRNFAREARVT